MNVITRRQAREEASISDEEDIRATGLGSGGSCIDSTVYVSTEREDVEVRDEPLWLMIEECEQLEASAESEPSAVELSSLEEESGLETSEVESGSIAGENAVSTALEDLVPVEGTNKELIQMVNTLGPVGQGNDGEKFREAGSSDESLKEWRDVRGGLVGDVSCWSRVCT